MDNPEPGTPSVSENLKKVSAETTTLPSRFDYWWRKLPIWLQPQPLDPSISAAVQAELIRQEHRTVRIMFNALEYLHVDPADPRYRAAREAIVWRLFTSSGVRTGAALGAGLVVSLSTIYLALKANEIATNQTKLLADQTRIAEEQKDQAMIQNALAEANRMALLHGEVGEIVKQMPPGKGEPDATTRLRIAALCRTLRPYRALEWIGGKAKLEEKLLSRERGELLLACVASTAPNAIDLTNAIEHGDETWPYYSNCEFEGADLPAAKFPGANFNYCQLSNARLVQSDLVGAHFVHARLTGAEFNGSVFGRKRDTVIKVKGRDGNEREDHFFGADFWGAELAGAAFGHTKVFSCNFELANLEDANFPFAIIYESEFQSAKLPRATAFRYAKLAGLHLTDARVQEPDWLQTVERVAEKARLTDRWKVIVDERAGEFPADETYRWVIKPIKEPTQPSVSPTP